MKSYFMILLIALSAIVSLPTTMATSLLRSENLSRKLEKMEYLAAMLPTPPYSCFIENGFDYVGNDMWSVQKPTAEECCTECYNAQAQGCKAYSWTNLNGGTCWLKSARGQIIVNPNVKSSILLFGNQPVCQLYNNLDYVGNDLTRVDGQKAEDCCDKCQKYLGCRAYSWSNYLGGSCWLKSKKGLAIYKDGVKSAEAYPTGGETCSLNQDVDYLDNDIGSAYSPTASGCCSICYNWQGCRAFAWTNQGGGTCWLKSVKGTQISKPGVISGQVRDNPPSTCNPQEDTDYVGNDLVSKPSSDPDLCCTICKEYPGCKAYSWSNYNGGTCWLKSMKGETAYKQGVKSAVTGA